MKLFMVDSHQQTAILLLVGEITRVVIKTYFSVKKLCIILSHHYNVQVFKYWDLQPDVPDLTTYHLVISADVKT